MHRSTTSGFLFWGPWVISLLSAFMLGLHMLLGPEAYAPPSYSQVQDESVSRLRWDMLVDQVRRGNEAHSSKLQELRTELVSLHPELRHSALATGNIGSQTTAAWEKEKGELLLKLDLERLARKAAEKSAERATKKLESSTSAVSATGPGHTDQDNQAVRVPNLTDIIQPDAAELGVQAEKQYWYQRNEKNEHVHPIFARYGANWPCFWGEDLTGTSTGDGSKWTCGIRLISKPCIVYSFGSRENVEFEKGVFELGLGCDIHIFDPTAKAPKGSEDLGFEYHKIGLGSKDGMQALENGLGVFDVLTLKTIMEELQHTHIDILKIDIDYMEHPVLQQIQRTGWPSVGQLLLEVHVEGSQRIGGVALDQLFANVETANLRLFHHEVNWEFGVTCCIEYSFIHKDWRPGKRNYSMNTSSTYIDIPLTSYRMDPQLVIKYLTGTVV